MNTYRIYEDLRSSLGEEAAKSLAHTLGPMFEELGETVTKVDFRELSATVGRLAEAQERTEVQTRIKAQLAALVRVTQSVAEYSNRTANGVENFAGMDLRDAIS